MSRSSDNIIQIGNQVIATEIEALQSLSVGRSFAKACLLLLACRGRVIVIGMGKSGHIGHKIAATMASTGTPAFFVHPAEASHGDLGMITDQDVVVMLSNSGEADEIMLILPTLKRLGTPIVAMTGNDTSSMAKNADVILHIAVNKEACPLNLAPTSSTTAALAVGDALAVALLEARGFTREDFARSHPAGRLGKSLLIRVADLMHQGDQLPVVNMGTKFSDALMNMTEKRLGMMAILHTDGKLAGLFTDGDLRRALNRAPDLNNSLIDDFITTDCTVVKPDILAEEALQIMEQHNINGLLVLDDDGKLVGALNMLDLLHAKVI